MLSTHRRWPAPSYLVLMSTLLLLPLWGGLRALAHNCFNITDFGILQEAIYKMPLEGNAWLTVRGVRAWADHFDPITWAAALGAIWADFNPHFLIIWEWSFWALGAAFIFTRAPNRTQGHWGLVAWLSCRPLLEALLYPIHPNTWAMLPLLILSYALIEQRWRWILALALFLPLYREIYPFCFLALALVALLRPRLRARGLQLFVLSSAWLLVIFILRPLLAGPVQNYGGALLKILSTDLLGALNYLIAIQEPAALLKIFAPLLILLAATGLLPQARHWRSWAMLERPGFLMLAFLAPYFLAHLLAGQFMHHYSIPFASMALGLFAFGQWRRPLLLNQPRTWLVLLTLVATASSSWTKYVQYGFFTTTKRCELSAGHAAATAEMLQLLRTVELQAAANLKILASGGVIPLLLKPQRQVYHLYSWIPTLPSYDVMIYERHNTGAHHPLSSTEIELLFQQCRPFATRIWLDNPFYFMLQGKFPAACTKLPGRSDHGT